MTEARRQLGSGSNARAHFGLDEEDDELNKRSEASALSANKPNGLLSSERDAGLGLEEADPH